MKRLLFICTAKDPSGKTQDECLDAALTCAAMGFDIEVNFASEALETSAKSVKHKMKTADQFGITISSCSEGKNKHFDNQINPKQLLSLIEQFDHAIHF